MMRLRALIFDVDGTIAETEEAHRQAFNRAFAEAGHDWDWSPERYRRLLGVTGGKERISAILKLIGETLPAEAVARLHRRKNELYGDAVAAGRVRLRSGVARLFGEARAAGVTLAIATTTSRVNLTALLRRHLGDAPLDGFGAVITGEDVAAKKPDPEVYHRALDALELEPATCLAFEDSRNGMLAARSADLNVVITPSRYTNHEQFEGAVLVQPSLDNPRPITLAVLQRLTGRRAPMAAEP